MRTLLLHVARALVLSCFVLADLGCSTERATNERVADTKAHLSNEEKKNTRDAAEADAPASRPQETRSPAQGDPLDTKPDQDTNTPVARGEPPCTSNVKKKQQGATVTYELMCSGTCGAGRRCEPRKATDLHGATRQWCGCADTEPSEGCGMVITTDTKGKAEAICPPRDCEGTPCSINQTGTLSGGSMKLKTLSCSCPD